MAPVRAAGRPSDLGARRKRDAGLAEPEPAATTGYRAAVTERMLLLPAKQFVALEAAANHLDLPVAQLLRRTINDFLRNRGPVGPDCR